MYMYTSIYIHTQIYIDMCVFATQANRALSARAPQLELFWDGGCPLCEKEISYYKTLDTESLVRWTDIDSTPEALTPHGVTVAQVRVHPMSFCSSIRVFHI